MCCSACGQRVAPWAQAKDGRIVPRLQSLLSSTHAVQAYAKLRPDVPELADLTSAAAMDETVVANGKGAKRQRIYEDHLPESEITAGLKRGTLHQVGHAW